MKPTVPELQNHFAITLEDAENIVSLIRLDKPVEDTLIIINNKIGGYGIEYLNDEYPNFVYINMGDTYTTTIYHDGNDYHIGTWGDYLETHEIEYELTFTRELTIKANSKENAIETALEQIKNEPIDKDDLVSIM